MEENEECCRAGCTRAPQAIVGVRVGKQAIKEYPMCIEHYTEALDFARGLQKITGMPTIRERTAENEQEEA